MSTAPLYAMAAVFSPVALISLSICLGGGPAEGGGIEDFNTITCDSGDWSYSGGTCTCSVTYTGDDGHIKVVSTKIANSGGYADYADATAWGDTKSNLNFNPDGTKTESKWNGVHKNLNGDVFTLAIEDSNGGCASDYGDITWTFDDTDAGVTEAFMPVSPGWPEEICPLTEQQHDTVRKLTGIDGATGLLPISIDGDRTDAGAKLERVEILDFDGAASLTFDSANGPIELTPANPVVDGLDMGASTLVFQPEGMEANASPLALVRTSCAPGPTTDDVPPGYEIGASLLGLADAELQQALVSRIVESEAGPYLLTTVRGGSTGSTLALEPAGPDAWVLAEARLEGLITLTRVGDDLHVVGTANGVPVDVTLPPNP